MAQIDCPNYNKVDDLCSLPDSMCTCLLTDYSYEEDKEDKEDGDMYETTDTEDSNNFEDD